MDGVNLAFLNEPYINTDNYRKGLDSILSRRGNFVNLVLKGVKKSLLHFAEKQGQNVFEQVNKELMDTRSIMNQVLHRKLAEKKAHTKK